MGTIMMTMSTLFIAMYFCQMLIAKNAYNSIIQVTENVKMTLKDVTQLVDERLKNHS